MSGISSLISTTDRSTLPRRDKEPDGAPTSLTGQIERLILSNPNTTTTRSHSQTDLDQPPTKLPPELLLNVFELCSHEDQKTCCLLSHSSRQLAMPCLFRRVVFSHYVAGRIEGLDKARGDVKAAIKELILNDGGWGKWSFDSILFPFLRSLPNLQSFRWRNHYSLSDFRQGFHQLVASLQHCPLEDFAYWGPHARQEPVTAPPRLKSLSIRISHTPLYDLIQPSFSTLVQLEIYSTNFDLVQLRPVGGTLRKFVYQVGTGHPEVLLDVIPDVFPHLTSLAVYVQRNVLDLDLQWKSSYDDSIAKNTKLQDLTVFARSFTFCDRNPTAPHVDCKKCARQRIEATRTLATACTALKHCRWRHSFARYSFDLRPSKKKTTTRLRGNDVFVRVERAVYRGVPEPFSENSILF